jgi:hypothetical protein
MNMGEYIEVNGKLLKIGTCEDLYYVRISDLRELVKTAKHVGGNLEPAEYLNPENEFRYRFPFPDEDGIGGGNYTDYDYGALVFLSEELAPSLWAGLGTWDHFEICHHIDYRGVCRVSIFTSCPLSEKPPERMSDVRKVVIISQQKQVEGELWVVIGCPYCQAKIRIDRREAEELAGCCLKMAADFPSRAFWKELGRRVLDGYR